MSVYQDIDKAINLMRGFKKPNNKVNIFPNYSLKHFK